MSRGKRLTPLEIITICERIKLGDTPKNIGYDYGISVAAISIVSSKYLIKRYFWNGEEYQRLYRRLHKAAGKPQEASKS